MFPPAPVIVYRYKLVQLYYPILMESLPTDCDCMENPWS